MVAGQVALSPLSSRPGVQAYRQHASRLVPSQEVPLTAREREGPQRLTEGLSRTELAPRLKPSPRTLEVQRQRMMNQLDIPTLPELGQDALRQKLISLAD